MDNYIIVAGLYRRSDKILLVKHRSEYGSIEYWTVPGGTAASEENAISALQREFSEETGFSQPQIGNLLYVVQHMNYHKNWQSVVLTFEILHCTGEHFVNDPDEDIIDIDFFHSTDAIKVLEDNPFTIIKQPLISYLEENSRSYWLFEEYKKREFILK